MTPRLEYLRTGAAAAALSALLGGCTTGDERWRALSREGPLAGWAACMESDGYRAYLDAADSAARAAGEGATPITDTQIFLIGLERCEALAAGTRAADLAPQNRNRLYRDTERMLLRKLASGTRLN